MASFVTFALAALLCGAIASPIPEEADRDASASAPSNYLDCATAVGQGNGLTNCSIPAVPGGWNTGGMPSPPATPEGMPNISQGVDCATAVGQGSGFNNCSTIFQPPNSFTG